MKPTGYYKVRDTRPKEQREVDLLFFYCNPTTKALSYSVAILSCTDSKVLSNYDPSNPEHPALVEVSC